jgi:hypothetical protein
LTGGSGAPIPLRLPETTRNRLVVRSVDDRIDGFTLGVLATGSRRFFSAPLNAAPKNNHIDLQLVGTTISTPRCASTRQAGNRTGATGRTVSVADFQLIGGWVQSDALPAGEGNTVRVEFRGVTGSGTRGNKFANAATFAGGALSAALQGTGNRLEVVGDPLAFTRNNRGIDPAPGATFFTRGK